MKKIGILFLIFIFGLSTFQAESLEEVVRADNTLMNIWGLMPPEEYGEHSMENVLDDDMETFWMSPGGDEESNDYFIINFSRAYKIDHFIFYTDMPKKGDVSLDTSGVKIEVSNDPQFTVSWELEFDQSLSEQREAGEISKIFYRISDSTELKYFKFIKFSKTFLQPKVYGMELWTPQSQVQLKNHAYQAKHVSQTGYITGAPNAPISNLFDGDENNIGSPDYPNEWLQVNLNHPVPVDFIELVFRQDGDGTGEPGRENVIVTASNDPTFQDYDLIGSVNENNGGQAVDGVFPPKSSFIAIPKDQAKEYQYIRFGLVEELDIPFFYYSEIKIYSGAPIREQEFNDFVEFGYDLNFTPKINDNDLSTFVESDKSYLTEELKKMNESVNDAGRCYPVSFAQIKAETITGTGGVQLLLSTNQAQFDTVPTALDTVVIPIPDMGALCKVEIPENYRHVPFRWVRIQSTDGSLVRVYELKLYTMQQDAALQNVADKTLNPYFTALRVPNSEEGDTDISRLFDGVIGSEGKTNLVQFGGISSVQENKVVLDLGKPFPIKNIEIYPRRDGLDDTIDSGILPNTTYIEDNRYFRVFGSNIEGKDGVLIREYMNDEMLPYRTIFNAYLEEAEPYRYITVYHGGSVQPFRLEEIRVMADVSAGAITEGSLVSGDKITACLPVYNYGRNMQWLYLAVALYDGERMVDIKLEKQYIDRDVNAVATITYLLPAQLGQDPSLKVFCFNNMEEIKPLRVALVV